MFCPRCLRRRTSNPDDISCGCGVLWFDTPEPDPPRETKTPEFEAVEYEIFPDRIAEQHERDRGYEDDE